jgi:alcohol dehydrogenase
MNLISFDHQQRTRLIFGNGGLNRLGTLARELGGKRALIVSDPGIIKAGYVEKAISWLNQENLTVATYGQVRENPSTEDVEQCAAMAREFQADILIGLGGGSSMDTAKGCNFIVTNGGRMQDYWGTGKAKHEMLPLIAIPTTAGTGSECQSYALISDAETHVKMACGDHKAAAKIAILDPELTLSQPKRVTVCTGIDALSHALETAVTRKRNSWSSLFSRESFLLLEQGFSKVLEQPDDLEGRGKMLLGAAYAGIAIENSMLGAAHSCANPLTAKFHLIHGEAVGIMLPHVIRFNRTQPEIQAIYQSYYPYDLADRVSQLLIAADMPQRLAVYGVKESDVVELAEMACKQWTAQFNPRSLAHEDFVELYRSAL